MTSWSAREPGLRLPTAILVLVPSAPRGSVPPRRRHGVACRARTVNATLQLFLPGWVRARGLAIFTIVLFGSQAPGAAAWGFVAEQVGSTRRS